MPGSKRRLKKAAAAAASPSEPTSPVDIPESHHRLSNPFKHSSKDSPDKSKSPTSFLSDILHPHKSRQSEVMSPESDSIASDPGNYMSDEALNQDLKVEEMIQRGQSIGSGHHRLDDGVEDLNAKMDNMTPPSRVSSIDSTPAHNPGNATVPAPGAAQYTAAELMGAPRGKKKSSKQRFAERQARKQHAFLNSLPPVDPSWTASLRQERDDEIQVITEACDVLGREIYEIAPDGHCMFNAIADQLLCLGMLSKDKADAKHMRHEASSYMLKHPDDFMPFLPSITGEDSEDATSHDGLMTSSEFKKYCKLVAETGEWGGEPEIQALSRRFEIPVHVVQRGPPTIVSHGGNDDSFGGALTAEKSAAQGDRVIRISYHRRMYGLGEHYNSLRKTEPVA